MTILVTGAAGFIGFHVAAHLLAGGADVLGLDCFTPYYDRRLKDGRVADLKARFPRFRFVEVDIADSAALAEATAGVALESIVHLAAQPGVRFSIENPRAYVHANLAGHLEMLELARHAPGLRHFVYASSSSVYGGNTQLPFSVADRVDRPISLYAATKRADELMSETYAHLFRLPMTGLRFFTVYGPWGRPDMAVWGFTESLFERRPIRLYAGGHLRRDFTYIDDIVAGILACLANPPADDGAEKPGGSLGPHALYNIGNNRPETVLELVSLIEAATGISAITEDWPMQPGDVEATYADIAPLTAATGWKPTTPLSEGIPRFVEWYRGWRAR